jgi:hypothetical protein
LPGDHPPKEGEDCARIMSRAERNEYRARVGSLDERDHAIFLSLLEHKVLTTDQIKSLLFGCLRRCQRRLSELRDLGFVASFAPKRGLGEGRAIRVLVSHEDRLG